MSASNAPSASPSLWNAHFDEALHEPRNVSSAASKPFICAMFSSLRSLFGSVAPSSTAARTVSGNSVAHVAPSSLP